MCILHVLLYVVDIRIGFCGILYQLLIHDQQKQHVFWLLMYYLIQLLWL